MSGHPLTRVGCAKTAQACKAGPREDDDAMLHTLSVTPPDQWGAWLESLGASVRPVNHKKQAQDSDPSTCTISSLLGVMETTPSVGKVNSERPQEVVQKVGSRARAKRTLAAATPNESREDDVRDLDELLRDLGEQPTKATQKKKKKKSKAGKLCKQVPPPPPRAEVESETEEEEEDEDEMVATAAAAVAVGATANALEEIALACAAESEAVEAITEALTVEAVDGEIALSSAREIDAVEATTEIALASASEADAEDGEGAGTASAISKSLAHSLSEGMLPKAYQSPSRPQHTQEPTMPYRSPSFYSSRPSVATWMASAPPVPAFSPPETSNTSSRSSAADHQAQTATALCQSQPACRNLQWSARPSVGTWLGRPAAQPHVEPPPPFIAASNESCRAKTRSYSPKEVQLWPDTPTSTPPTTPRYSCSANPGGGVVWVPVPVHLVDKVQSIIRYGI